MSDLRAKRRRRVLERVRAALATLDVDERVVFLEDLLYDARENAARRSDPARTVSDAPPVAKGVLHDAPAMALILRNDIVNILRKDVWTLTSDLAISLKMSLSRDLPALREILEELHKVGLVTHATATNSRFSPDAWMLA